MKNFSLFLLIISFSFQAKCQPGNNYTQSFDDSSFLNRIFIDTLNNNNDWQIGKPLKTVFDSAVSFPNVIVTDTVNSYVINDTSVFLISNSRVYPLAGWLDLNGKYYVNTDTLTDYGIIEFSPDSGISWLNLLTYQSNAISWGNKPVLSGNSNGWKSFWCSILITDTFSSCGAQGSPLLFRFTFISDSVQTNKDGLMYDNLFFHEGWESINETRDDDMITVFPIPASGEISIHKKHISKQESIQVYDLKGELVFENLNFTGVTINLQQLNNGIYLLKYLTDKNYSLKKFIVQH